MNLGVKLIGLANLITDTIRLLRVHLRIVEHTNLAYVEPHKVIIGDTLYLFFNEQKHFYIGNLKKKIPIADLSDYIARH